MKTCLPNLKSVTVFLLFTFFFSLSTSYGQAPQKMSLQAVVRNSGGALIQNSNVGFRISILQGSSSGSVVYSETHTILTNANGLATLEIGGGSVVSGSFATIDWSNGPYFIKSETDPTGGTAYTISGTNELLSVPYALHAETATNYTETDPNFVVWDKSTGISITSSQVSNFQTSVTNNPAVLANTAKNSYPAADATKLAGIAAGAEVNVNPDWNAVSGDAQILNKPTITIPDGSETKITAGTNVTVTGTGTNATPYVVNASGSGWGLTGNSGTIDGTNFIGTTDNIPFNIRVNNRIAGRIDPNGTVFIGYQAGNSNTNTNNTGIGYQTLGNATGGYNTSIGHSALFSNTTGNSNTASGWNTLASNTTGNLNTANGSQSLMYNTTGIVNTAIGWASLYSNSNGGYNTSIGARSLVLNSTGANNTALGYQAGLTSNFSNANSTGSNNTFIGYNSGPGTPTQLTNATAIGYNALVSSDNSLVLGGTGADAVKVGIGVTTPTANLDILGNVKIADGTQGAGKVLTSDAVGVATWQTAGGSGWGLTGNSGTVDGTNFIGTTDNVPLNIKVNNEKAGRIDPTLSNTFFGYKTSSYPTGFQNTSIGFNAGSSGAGNNNTANGSNALQSSTGSNNTGMGAGSLQTNEAGNNNTALGFGADVIAGGLNNTTAIGSGAIVNVDNAIQLGNSGVTQVFAGTGTTATLIAGGLKITGGAPAVGKVLTSDAAGVATWQAAAGGGWGLTGNSGTVDGTNFIGTSDGIPLNLKMNNQKAGRIDFTNAFFGYQSGMNNTGGVNTAIGSQSLLSNTSGYGNTANGNSVLRSNTTGANNTAIGMNALFSSVAGSGATAIGRDAMYFANNTSTPFINNNVAVGFEALRGSVIASDNTGNNNTALGVQTLWANTNGSNNTTTGFQTLYSNTTGSYNTANGFQSLNSNTTGSFNTAYGFSTLSANTTGTYNTAVGFGAGVGSGALTNATAIGFTASVSTSNAIQLGNASVTQIFAGTGTNATLIAGGLKITGGAPAAGKVLTSDAAGVATWQAAGGGGWGLTGNSGTVDGTNFIGTTDNFPLNFRVNNQKAGRIDATGPTFFGYMAGNNNSVVSSTGFGNGALSSNTSGAGNTASGNSSLYFNTTGSFNTASGYQTLFSNTTGQQNTANGYTALYANTTGNYNTAEGYKALFSNTTGEYNTASGNSALLTNTTGNFNTAFGYSALTQNSTAYYNTAVGFSSLQQNTTGGGNTSTGYQTLTNNTVGFYNAAYGYQALNTNSGGSNATAIGYGAMRYANNSSTYFINYNVAVGYEALRGSTTASTNTGIKNTAVGYQSLWSNTIGNENVASGNNTLYSNTTGGYNNATGSKALFANTVGNYNNAYGFFSMVSNTTGNGNSAYGDEGLVNNTSGSNNTAIGFLALLANITGSNNTALGYGADVSSGALTNATALGSGAIVNASNKVRIGNSSVTVVEAQVALTFPSDKRLKDNITDAELGLDFILKLHPVQYTMKEGNGKTDYGFIAQELETALGNRNVNMVNKDGEYYTVRYNDLLSPMVKAVQEQQKIIESLTGEIRQLKAQADLKQSALHTLEAENAKIKSDFENRLNKLEELVARTANR